jgi:hypothetical protein
MVDIAGTLNVKLNARTKDKTQTKEKLELTI